MTRRIVIAILAIVWLILLTAGISTYFITRSILINDLDETIIGRVASLPEIERPASLPHSSPDANDRYVIQDDQGTRISSGSIPPGSVAPPIIISRQSSRLADGTRLVTLELQAFARRTRPDGPLREVTVIYSASAAQVDALLTRLLYSLSGFGIVAALATIVVAHSAARAALKPLHETANAIGAIDERSLDRRIDIARLPRELVPVGTTLNAMLARLETAFGQRKQFLADASHELRTPVAALVTTLEVVLRRKRDADEYVRSLDRCLSDAKLLHQLVTALIDQARAERFAIEPDLGPVPVSTILRQCIQIIAPLAERKGCSLIPDFPDSLQVISDEQLLRSTVCNLLSNAVEYVPTASPGQGAGTITLSATLLPDPTPLPPSICEAIPEGVSVLPHKLLIHVRDNGPGIPAEHLPNIFEPFYRADAARTNVKQHLGLGLALVRANVRAMGGDCRVKSPPDGQILGCIFTLDLPTSLLTSENPTLPLSANPEVPIIRTSS